MHIIILIVISQTIVYIYINNDRLTRWACSKITLYAAHVLISSQNIYSKILGGGGGGSS